MVTPSLTSQVGLPMDCLQPKQELWRGLWGAMVMLCTQRVHRGGRQGARARQVRGSTRLSQTWDTHS